MIRSPHERSDMRVQRGNARPGFRYAHPGYACFKMSEGVFIGLQIVGWAKRSVPTIVRDLELVRRYRSRGHGASRLCPPYACYGLAGTGAGRAVGGAAQDQAAAARGGVIRSPHERSDMRVQRGNARPGFRYAHPGYLLIRATCCGHPSIAASSLRLPVSMPAQTMLGLLIFVDASL